MVRIQAAHQLSMVSPGHEDKLEMSAVPCSAFRYLAVPCCASMYLIVPCSASRLLGVGMNSTDHPTMEVIREWEWEWEWGIGISCLRGRGMYRVGNKQKSPLPTQI